MASPVVNSGVGLMLVNDKLGPLKNISAKLSYSYHYKLEKLCYTWSWIKSWNLLTTNRWIAFEGGGRG